MRFKTVTSLVLILAFLQGCERHIKMNVDTQVPADRQYFDSQPGHKLAYRLFLPNSYTGWERQAENEFEYSQVCSCYQVFNLDISGSQVDNWGTRFKVASVDWKHEFGFTSAHRSTEQSKFGVSDKGSFVTIRQITYPADMYFELPKNSNAHYLHVQFKVLDNSDSPFGLMHTFYTDKPLPEE